MSEKIRQKIDSEIINNKKQLILKVDQTNDVVYPNELFKYQIYCKNVSGETIKNVHLQVINPSSILIDEDDEFEGINIGDLKNGQSHLIYLSSRCGTPGEFTVHFLCFGDDSDLVTKKLDLFCSYESYSNKTTHKIHIYDFSPYEETYELLSRDFNEDVTQIIKRQKLPFSDKQKMISSDISKNIIADESNYIIKRNQILYGDQQIDILNKNNFLGDEHSYHYIDRENFNTDSVETFEGENLKEIFDNINKKSKFFNATFLRTGTNNLLNDFQQYNPDGFIYRFGLMSSEIFHNIGILPNYAYMNDYLFRWAMDKGGPLNLRPIRSDMNWDQNKWVGHSYHVYKTYSDEYKEQIIQNEDYTPLFEFMDAFEDEATAQEYIKIQNDFDDSNEHYIYTTDGLERIKKYQYLIKESFFDDGVFFVDIPLNKIPTNFLLLDTDEIESIIEKTKPYGMKGLIRYVIDTQFNIDLGMNIIPKPHPQVKIDFSTLNKINYAIKPYQYHKVIETICYKDENDEVHYEDVETIKKIPSGFGQYNGFRPDAEITLKSLNPDITQRSILDIEPNIENKRFGCKTVKDLSYLSQIQDILYKNNFDEISFYIEDVQTTDILETEREISGTIAATDYKLWKDCLSENKDGSDGHSCWWDIDTPQQNDSNKNDEEYLNTYYFSKILKTNPTSRELGKVDFIEMPLETKFLTQDGIEMGIGFEDISGKLHGLSSEYIKKDNTFKIKHADSIHNNFNIRKEGFADIIGIAYKFTKLQDNTVVILFIKKRQNNKIKYHYFSHIITNKIKSVFCFTRNNKDINGIRKWSNLIKMGKGTDRIVHFNTPQYNNIKTYDPDIIKNKETTNWKNIYRIDKNKQSYSIIQNDTIDEIDVDDIDLCFENIDIPDDSVVKNVRIKATMESNSYKNIYPSLRLQDGFITEESYINNICLHPSNIEFYPAYNNNTKFYENKYIEAEVNNSKKSMEVLSSKILENELFHESIDEGIEFLNDIDSYITIKKPHWIEISEFCDYNIVSNEINEMKFYIEGYNSGKEVNLIAQSRHGDVLGEKVKTTIQTGYFRKSITIPVINGAILKDISVRFRYADLNDDLNIFDTYIEPYFASKQTENKEFTSLVDEVKIEKKKNIEVDLIDEEIPGYILKNGFTTKIGFDQIDSGEYYRIYSIELEITYQKQNIDLIISDSSQIIEDDNLLTVVSGKMNGEYASGMFFNEVIMPGSFQPLATYGSNSQGIELQDALYQSFTATADNITSITLFPDGFVGNPDINLKISLYENKGNTPNRLVKEVNCNGWSKRNPNLKNAMIVTYDFNVNNLNIGEQYWFKIEVQNPQDNNYYLLKYYDEPVKDKKLLARINNNYINPLGALRFYINTINLFDSFKSLPISEDKTDFSDPKIFISLNKRVGEIYKLKIQKASD